MSGVVQLISSNCGKINPDSIQEYINAGGFEALKKAIKMKPIEIIEEVKASKLMGRGGAAYPCGKKWEHLYHIKNNPKYIVCNADEGEPGTFKDKLLLDGDPFKIIEGIIIAGYVFNSNTGYIYIRGEYPVSQKKVQKAIDSAIAHQYLGENILGTDFNFNIHVITGAGAYICGENSALLNSIEGKPGRPRLKPPHLAEVGLFNMPTLVNNVETLACIPYIVTNGGAKYSSYGTVFSGGTKLVCLSGNVVNKGVFEVPFGTSLREIIYELGGGIPNGRKLKMVHIGGQSGPCFSEKLLDTPLCYKELKSKGLSLGSGAIVVIDDSNCIVDYVKSVTEFFIHESCGKCTPCREGNRHLHNLLCKLENGKATKNDIALIKQLASTMTYGSFCGLGQTASVALTTCMEYFMDEFENHINKRCSAEICEFEKGTV